MCFGAIYWAGITKVYFANTKKDAEKIGFDDQFIHEEAQKRFYERNILFEHVPSEFASDLFEQWVLK